MIRVFYYDSNKFFLRVDWIPEGVGMPNTTTIPIPNTPLPDTLCWRFVESSWVAVAYFSDPDVAMNYGTKITKLAFLTRLGDTVLGTIEAASRANNALGYAAAVIKIKHSSSTYIDLSLPETHTDIQKLVDYGFIDTTKRDEIINTPVAEKEVPLFISNQII